MGRIDPTESKLAGCWKAPEPSKDVPPGIFLTQDPGSFPLSSKLR